MEKRLGDEKRPIKEPWLVAATVGLGLCLACEQYERYYGLWALNLRSFGELVAIVAVVGLVLAGFSGLSLRRGKPLYSRAWLLVLLTVSQTLGVVVREGQELGWIVPEWLCVVAPLLRQSGFLLLVLYAQFFLGVGIRKSVRALIWGLLISGGLQIACSVVPGVVVMGTILLYMPGAAALLAVANRLRSSERIQAEREDIDAELEASGGFTRSLSFWECCVSIALVNVLLLALHDRGVALQDGGTASAIMQLSAGLGCILAGVAFLALLNYLQEAEYIDLLRVTILPIVLIVLYFSASVGASAPPMYFVPLCVCYSVLILLVWAIPRYYRLANSAFLCVCVTFFAFKLGWGLGIFGFTMAPRLWGDGIENLFVFGAYAVLLLFTAFHAIRTWRMNQINEETSEDEETAEDNEMTAFAEACIRVVEAYGLTPRESEVLPYLARGRNARYISEALVISDGTARTHIMHIYQKMDVNSQQALMDEVEAMEASLK